MSVRKRLTIPLAELLDRFGALEPAFQQRRSIRRRYDDIVAGARRRTLHPPPDTLGDDAVRWVRRGSHWVLCRVRRDHRSALSIRRNLEVAHQLVRTGGARYFFVPVEGSDATRLGVPDDDRVALLGALLTADLPEETYLLLDGESTLRAPPVSHRRTRRSFVEKARHARRWTVVLPVVDPSANEVQSDSYGCDIEFWGRAQRGDRADVIRAPHRNAVAGAIELERHAVDAVRVSGLELPAPREFAVFTRTRSSWFPIDAVYTWVDGSDSNWLARRTATLRGLDTGAFNEDAMTRARFEHRDELRYSLRSLEQYADFVRHVYLVTDGQIPDWLDSEARGLTVVDHSEIFLVDDHLPTFNSQAIEARLHRIPDLSEHYLYLNDDVFFGRRVEPDLFFTRSGMTKYFVSSAQIGTGPSTPEEPAITSAAKNGRELLLREFGYFPTFKFKHTPHAQRRSVHDEIQRRFPDAYRAVGRHPFRSHRDISAASSLHHHVGNTLGISAAADISYDYFNLPSSNLPDRLERVRALALDTWCLNEGTVPLDQQESVDGMVTDFLHRALPWPSRFERRDEGR